MKLCDCFTKQSQFTLNSTEDVNFNIVDIPVIFHILYKTFIPSEEVLRRQIDVLNGEYDSTLHTTIYNGQSYTHLKDLGFKITKKSALPATSPNYTNGGKYIKIRFHYHSTNVIGLYNYSDFNDFINNFMNNSYYEQVIHSNYPDDTYYHALIADDGGEFGLSTIIDQGDKQLCIVGMKSLPYFEDDSKIDRGYYDGGDVLVHEFGHSFGLRHLDINTQNSVPDDDGVEDTPLQVGNGFGSNYYTTLNLPNGIDNENYMTYYPDTTKRGFTDGQMKFMQSYMKTWNLKLYNNTRMKFCNLDNSKKKYTILDALYNNFSNKDLTIDYDFTNPKNNLTPNNSIILRNSILINIEKNHTFNFSPENNIIIRTTKTLLSDTFKYLFTNITQNIEFNSESINLTSGDIITYFDDETSLYTFLTDNSD